jgi:hypothetical protein
MDSRIKKILSYKVIAVVGLSKNPGKPSHYVPRYMQEHGYRVIPVNPTADEILGEKCYHSIDEVQEKIDVVNIFRPSQEVLPIVEKAIRKKVKAVWMQEGIVNKEAAELAEQNGVLVVMDRCMMKEHGYTLSH